MRGAAHRLWLGTAVGVLSPRREGQTIVRFAEDRAPVVAFGCSLENCEKFEVAITGLRLALAAIISQGRKSSDCLPHLAGDIVCLMER